LTSNLIPKTMSEYTKQAEEFLKEQGIPDKHVYTRHKLGGQIPVHISWVLTQYAEYLEALSLRQSKEDDQEDINETLRNAGALG
jgi:hypothetical protein